MKRVDLIRHILKKGCVFVREGANHSIFFNPEFRKTSTVPRHKETNNFLANKICKDLGIPQPNRSKPQKNQLKTSTRTIF